MIDSSGPLSVLATLSDGSGGLESVGPASNSNNLIVPFAQGTAGGMDLTMFNAETAGITAVIAAIGPNGQTLGAVQRFIPALGTVTESVDSMFPAAALSLPRDIAHLVVRTPIRIFGPEQRLYAHATLHGFIDTGAGILAGTEPAVVNAVPDSSGVPNAWEPFFVQGGDYVTMIQIINTSPSAASVTLTARGPDGNTIDSLNPAVIQVPANGSIRRSVKSFFSFGPELLMGSITVQSGTPVIVTEAIASATRGGMVLVPAISQKDANLVFRIRDANPTIYTGFAFFNPSASSANLTLRYIRDDGVAVSGTALTVQPFTTVSRNLIELLPEARTRGFLHIASDVPIVMSSLEGRADNTMLGNLPPMHPQPDYTPPNPTQFFISGAVKHNGAPFSGVNVQVTGAVNASTVTDELGAYVFQNVPPGPYTLRLSVPGYTASPSQIDVTIASESRRGNDFAVGLVTPTVTYVGPPAIVAGSAATVVSVAGAPIIGSSQIVFEGNALPTALTTASVPVTVVSATGGISVVIQPNVPVLQATIPAQSLAVPHVGSILIRTTGPGGSVSSTSQTFVVGSPAPVLTSFGNVPSQLMAGNSGFTMTIAGTGFLPGVRVLIQGVARPTTFQTPTTLQVVVPAEDLGKGAILKVTALNPAPTVGPSNALDLPVLNPVPGITSIAPTSAEVRLEANAPPLPITVAGFGFQPDAKILVDNVEIPTQFVNAGLLTGSIPRSSLQTGGVRQITVRNPPPTVSQSEALPLFVSNLRPILSSIDSGPLTFDPSRPSSENKYVAPIILHGSNFASNSIYEVSDPCNSGSASFVSIGATVVSAHEAILPVTIGCAAAYDVRVRTPQPGGGISEVLTFIVASSSQPGTPVISSLSPSAVPVGSASFTLTILGANFESGAVVSFGSAILYPTANTGTSISVTVPAYLVTQTGPIPVVVTNPSPTGSSNRVLFYSANFFFPN
jgi:hypothetical protein